MRRMEAQCTRRQTGRVIRRRVGGTVYSVYCALCSDLYLSRDTVASVQCCAGILCSGAGAPRRWWAIIWDKSNHTNHRQQSSTVQMSSIQSGVARHQSPGRVPHGWVGGAGQGRVWFGSAQVTGGAGWPPTLHIASLQCNPACLITNCTLWLPSSPNSAVECWAAEVCAPQVWWLELVQVVMKRNGLLNLSPVPAKTSDIATKARHSYSVSRQTLLPLTAPHMAHGHCHCSDSDTRYLDF